MAEHQSDAQPDIGERLFGGEGHAAGLLAALRDAGLRIGPREEAAVAALMATLVVRTEAPVVLSQFGPLLAPLLARSAEERAIFFRVFGALAGAPARADTVVPVPRRPWWLLSRRHALLVGVVLVALAAAVWAVQRPGPEPVPTVDGNSRPSPPSLPSSAAAEAPLPTASLPGLRRLVRAAEATWWAPTLEELGDILAPELPPELVRRWSPAAYTQRLHEHTGLPLREPLPLAGAGHSSERALRHSVALATAVDLIEHPGLGARPAELLAELRRQDSLLQDRQLPTAEAMAAHFAASLAAQQEVLSQDRETALDQLTRLGVPGAAGRRPAAVTPRRFAAASERALAVSENPAFRRTWPEAPWLQRDTPPAVEVAPSWASWVAMGVPLLCGLAWLGGWINRRKAFLRQRRPDFPPLHTDLLVEAQPRVNAGRVALQTVLRRLLRRSPEPSGRLDVEATIAATIRQGGHFVQPVFGAVRSTPEYLVLLERRSIADQQYLRLHALVRDLAKVVPVDLFTYQRLPDQLLAERGGRAQQIERLAARYPEHRLILLGTGDGFLDHATGRPLPAAQQLASWRRRALLTPRPIAAWSRDELDLAQALDLPIGRATSEGFAALPAMLGLEGADTDGLLHPAGDGYARPLPATLRANSSRYLGAVAPGLNERRTATETLRALRGYLDAPGFDWLCALAVYPALQWDLTLWLGTSLPGRAAPGAPTMFYSEQRLAALTQLPWFRAGNMPNWLRRALIAEMPAPLGAAVRAAIVGLLKAAAAGPDAAENERIRFRIGREAPREPLPPDLVLEDEVLLDFLARGQLEDFHLDRPPGGSRTRWRPDDTDLAGVGVAVFYAVLAFALTPRPSDGGLPTGAWLPLMALALGGGLALAVTHLRALWTGLRDVLEETAPFGLVSAAIPVGFALGSLLPTTAPREPASIGLAVGGGLIVACLLAEVLARRLGARLPPVWDLGRQARRLALGALGCLFLFGTAGGRDPLSSDPIAQGFMVAGGLGWFGLGLVLVRWVPRIWPVPRAKRPLLTRSGRWARALPLGVMLGGALPALLMAAWQHYASQQPAPRFAADAVAVGRILASSADGTWFATGGADGVVRSFNAKQPSTPRATIHLAGGPVVRLAIGGDGAAGVRLAAVTAGGTLRLFDGLTGALLETTDLCAELSCAQVAIGPDGAWGVTWLDDQGEGEFTSATRRLLLGPGLPAGLLAGPDAGTWIIALGNGQLALERPGQQPTAYPARLPTRPRLLLRAGSRVLAVGEDGSMLEADMALGADFAPALLNGQPAFGLVLPPPTPPPPPPRAPAPAAARTFLIFFDWNSTNMSDRARQIVAEAAVAAQQLNASSIEISGYTDTSQDVATSQHLSEHRAEAVAAEMVRLGIPRQSLAVRGFGKTNLLVPTADGVREPQNRRVEIILRGGSGGGGG